MSKHAFRFSQSSIVGAFIALFIGVTAGDIVGQTPAHLWSATYDGAAGTTTSVSVNSSGKIYLSGDFLGWVKPDGATPLTSDGAEDIFVAGYRSSGASVGAFRFGDPGIQFSGGVAADVTGAVYVAGSFEGTLDLVPPITSEGYLDIFLVKFTSDDTVLWQRRFGIKDAVETCEAITLDSDRNVIITGYFDNAVNFGGGIFHSVEDRDMYVAKFAPDGTHVWSRHYGEKGDQVPLAITVDANDDIWVTGFFTDRVDFGGGLLFAPGVTPPEAFLVKIRSSGTHLWSNRFGGTRYDYGRDVATDASGSVFVTGEFQETIDFGGAVLEAVPYGMDDAFVAKLAPTGAHVWSAGFGSATGYMTAKALAVDPDGNAYLGGSFDRTVSFGGPALTPASTNPDIFLASYEPDGDHRWSTRYGGGDYDYCRDLARSSAGHLIMTGTSGAVDFGGGPLTDGAYYLAAFSTLGAAPSALAVTDVENDAGGNVEVEFIKSGMDDGDASAPIVEYAVYRLDDANVNGPLTSARAGAAISWSLVAEIPATHQESYNAVVPTLADNVPTSIVVRALTANPNLFYDSPVAIGYSKNNLPTGVGDTPQDFTLSVFAAPNPFNPSTVVRFTLPSPGMVELRVFDIHGANIRTLVAGHRREGSHEVAWNGEDDGGGSVASGVYIAKVKHTGGSRTYKLLLLK